MISADAAAGEGSRRDSAPAHDLCPTGPAAPRYIDALLDDFDLAGDHRWNHLGHWDEPGAAVPGSRVDAQRRMNEILLSLAEVDDGRAVLDVGCGFGGTLQAIDSQFRRMVLVGLDIDDRQLRICRRLSPNPTNSLSWVHGDACQLPFGPATFPSILAIEALWHVPSRAAFFSEAARVLSERGRLAVVDLIVEPGAADVVGLAPDRLFDTLRKGFAPWPELDASVDGVIRSAEAAGLAAEVVIDATENTLPTYLDHGDSTQRPGAADFSRNEGVQLFVELHRRGALRVVYLGFVKQQAARNSP